MDHVVSPGKTTNDVHDEVIGYFGVGSKRAVIALSQDIEIHSRFEREKPFVVKLDDYWVTKDPSWLLPYDESTRQLDPYTTLVELNRLRIQITSAEIEELKKHLQEVYAKFIDRGAIIKVMARSLQQSVLTISGRTKSSFSNPTLASIPIEDRQVEAEIVSGLIDHPGDPDDSYGVFVYCNN